MRRIALAAALAVASLGALAGSASAADPIGTLCGSVHVTINGQSVVDQDTCQVLPPATP